MTQKYNNISSTYTIDSWKDWPTTTIFSWIHGNEPSWIEAHRRFLNEVEDWVIRILKWRIIWVLEWNQKAVLLNIREIEKNLNRLFLDENTSTSWYEDRRAQELKWILDESDYLLDLHSTSWASIPFAFVEKEHLEFAKRLWISHLVAWWWELEDWITSWDTENYINSRWWAWITFESWNHNNPKGAEVAYRILLNYLSTLGIIDESHFTAETKERIFINMEKPYLAETDKFTYQIEPENFMKVSAWTIIAIDWTQEVKAENDMILVMPKRASIVREWIEAFFIWKLT